MKKTRKYHHAIPITLLLASLALGCVDLDPFGFQTRDLPGDYRLHKHESGSYYVEDASGSVVMEGVVTRIGWNDEYIIAWRRAFANIDPNGWMVLDLTTKTLRGPLSEKEVKTFVEEQKISIYSVKEAWDKAS
jgi:hypothetical protein